MSQDIDRIQIGQTIRKERKKLNMTLEELASGLFSIGKMSNIENGVSEIQLTDIKLIADKLGIDNNQLLPNVVIENVRLKQRIQEIEFLISLKTIEEAIIQLEKINKEFSVEISENTSFQLELLYLKGKCYLLDDNDLSASTTFYSIVDFPTTSEKDIILRSKAQHKLGELYAKNNQYRMAIEHINKAIELIQMHKLEVPWKLYYNLAILHLYQRQYLKASVYLTFIKRTNPRLDYVDALIHLFSENYKEGLEKLDFAKNRLMELDDTEMMLKSVMASIYFSGFSPTSYRLRTENVVHFIDSDLTQKRFTDKNHLKFMTIILQAIISHQLSNSNTTKAGQYLEFLFNFEKNHDYQNYSHISIFLKALYTKECGKSTNEEIDELLAQAQEIMESREISNVQLYSILYERSLLNDELNTFAFKALTTMHHYTNLDSLDLIQFEHFMPDLISI